MRVCLCERVLRISHMHSVQCNKCYLDSAHCQSACRLEGPRFGIWFPIIISLIISESRFRASILCYFPSYLHAVFGEDDPNHFFCAGRQPSNSCAMLGTPGPGSSHGAGVAMWVDNHGTMWRTPNTSKYLPWMKHGMLRIPKLNRGVVRKSSN